MRLIDPPTPFICKIQPCLSNHEYQDGMCRFHYTLDGIPVKTKEVKPIAKESKKRAKENRLDQKQNKALKEKEPYCQIKSPVCTGFAQGAQHVKGRTGKKLTDVKHKITACNACNGWCESHPLEAKAKGVAKSRLNKN